MPTLKERIQSLTSSINQTTNKKMKKENPKMINNKRVNLESQ